jgi:hypothetical protein
MPLSGVVVSIISVTTMRIKSGTSHFARRHLCDCKDTRNDRPVNNYSVNIHDFQSWLHQRDRQNHDHIPVADKVLPLIAQAGQAGLTRGEIGKLVGDSFDRDALDDLLAGLVEFGLLTVARENGLFVFRASGNFPRRLPNTRRQTNMP